MQFTIDLLLYRPDYRGGKHDIPNGTKPDEQDFFQSTTFICCKVSFLDEIQILLTLLIIITTMNNLYPLKFKPIFKDKIWGGQKVNTELGMDYGVNQHRTSRIHIVQLKDKEDEREN